jgi:hypothetical protein
MTLVKEYIETNVSNTPIYSINIFNSIEEFDPGESLSQPAEYFEDLILSIQLPNEYHRDTIFEFMQSGHSGATWDITSR